MDQTLTHGLQAREGVGSTTSPPGGPPLNRRPSYATGAFLEDPAVAVGIVEAVSGLVQRQEHGAQTEGAHSLGDGRRVASHTAIVMFDGRSSYGDDGRSSYGDRADGHHR